MFQEIFEVWWFWFWHEEKDEGVSIDIGKKKITFDIRQLSWGSKISYTDKMVKIEELRLGDLGLVIKETYELSGLYFENE